MNESAYTLSDIDELLLHHADRYIKRVIGNAIKKYHRPTNKREKYNIIIIPLSQFEDDLAYEEPRYNNITIHYVKTLGIRIPIEDDAVYEALLSLTEMQRDILLQNVVLYQPIKIIAQRYGIGVRMAEKHKKNAIKHIKERLLSE